MLTQNWEITGIAGIHAIPIIFMCILQGTFWDRGIPCTFYGGNICSVYWKITEQRIFLHGISKYIIFSLYGLRCELNKKLLISEADNNWRNGISVQCNSLLGITFEYTVFPRIVSAETILFWVWPYLLWPLTFTS